MTSRVNTSHLGPLWYIPNLTFQSLFPDFSTQSMAASLFHFIPGITLMASLTSPEPVKYGCVPAVGQVYECHAFLLQREEQR